MRVRRDDKNGDMTFGRDDENYWVNSRFGVGQLVESRMMLWKGQWFLNVQDGMPWATRVLGKYTSDTRDDAVQDRINATTGVLDIGDYNSQIDVQRRIFTVHANINTVFGPYMLAGPK